MVNGGSLLSISYCVGSLQWPAAAAVTCAADFREKSENYYRFR